MKLLLFRYLAALIHSLSAMLHLELPMINVLSKIDLLKWNHEERMQESGNTGQEPVVDFGVDTLIDEQELCRIPSQIRSWNRNYDNKHRRLARKLCEVIADYSMLSFATLDINVRDKWNWDIYFTQNLQMLCPCLIMTSRE